MGHPAPGGSFPDFLETEVEAEGGAEAVEVGHRKVAGCDAIEEPTIYRDIKVTGDGRGERLGSRAGRCETDGFCTGRCRKRLVWVEWIGELGKLGIGQLVMRVRERCQGSLLKN